MSDEFKVQVADLNDFTVGELYPLYGTITSVEEIKGEVFVELNRQTRIKIKSDMYEAESVLDLSKAKEASGKTKIDLLKSRVLERGVFISELVSKDPEPVFLCHTMLFGKKEQPLH